MLKKYNVFITAFLMLAHMQTASAKVIGEEVAYSLDGVKLSGYLAYDDAIKGKRPGVLVIHEWWGHDAYARKRAEMLAKLGYTAFSLDMYGDGKVTSHPDDAKKFMTEVTKNMSVARARYKKALQLLTQSSQTDASNIAAIGYCFGGAMVLDMARQGLDVKGVASFHGSLGTQTPAQKGKVKAKIRVFNGADDKFVSAKSIDDFRLEMQKADVDFEFINYPGAKHSFTNPGSTWLGKKYKLPLEYNEQADKKSWQKMQAFFKEIFTNKP